MASNSTVKVPVWVVKLLFCQVVLLVMQGRGVGVAVGGGGVGVLVGVGIGVEVGIGVGVEVGVELPELREPKNVSSSAGQSASD